MEDELLTPDEVSARTKGTVTVKALAQRRYKGLPPAFLKPTEKTVLYPSSEVDAWLKGSRRTGTGDAA